MIFTSMASSSKGNAYLVDDGKTRILLECGLPRKKLLKAIRYSPEEIAGCLLSHEHKDHAKCALDLLAAGMSVFMSQGTADVLNAVGETVVSHLEQFQIGSMDVVPFNVFHDAAEPLGYLLRSNIDGDILVFATDTVALGYRFPGVSILAIEANYDADILEGCERIPEKVRHRITNAHMEINRLCQYLRTLDLSACREIHLLHLSDATSHEEHFINRVKQVVPQGVRVTACEKERRI